MKNRIKKIRNYMGLTQEQFAKQLGLSRNHIAQIETGKGIASDRTLKDICREFSVNEEWLRTGTGDMFNLPEDETAALVSDLLEEPENEFYQSILELLRIYKQLSPESRNVLHEVGKMFLESMKNRKT